MKALAWAGALTLSAGVTAAALAEPGHSWVAWFSLIPLFGAIRVLRPAVAFLCGGVWGVCLYVFAAALASVIDPTARSLILLAVVPAAYACLGALLTRRIGFSPLILGLGWVLVEVALAPVGLRQGLLAGTLAGGTLAHWLGQLLGYVFVAFLVAGVNASLLAFLSHAGRGLPRQRSLALARDDGGRVHPSQDSFCSRPAFLRQIYPRGPPPGPIMATA